MHIRSKEQLLEWLGQNLTDRAALTALREGKAELITPFSPYPEGGWVIKIISKRGTVWFVHVLIIEILPPKLRYYIALSYNSMKKEQEKGIVNYE